MRRDRIVFWLNMPSPHQSSFLRAFADLLPQKTIVAVFETPLSEERLALGWHIPDLGRIETVMSPTRLTIDAIALSDPDNTIHIFGGMLEPMIRRALAICTATKALIGVVSEARQWEGLFGNMRLVHSYFVERPYRNRIDFVLAIGHLGVRWYLLCGYPMSRIFSWGYFVEKQELASSHCREENESLTDVVITFVGRCVPLKGIDTLLRALSVLAAQKWRLQIIGDGPQRRALARLCEQLGLANRVSFLGIKANSETRNMLAKTDLLVLPSRRRDGWGAVVSEALMSGASVVCSDHCGAADLIHSSGYGETFRAGSTEDLARVLYRWIERGPLTDSRRAEIKTWSECIEGGAAARYLIEIIAHVDEAAEKPIAPWFRIADTALQQRTTHVRFSG